MRPYFARLACWPTRLSSVLQPCLDELSPSTGMRKRKKKREDSFLRNGLLASVLQGARHAGLGRSRFLLKSLPSVTRTAWHLLLLIVAATAEAPADRVRSSGRTKLY